MDEQEPDFGLCPRCHCDTEEQFPSSGKLDPGWNQDIFPCFGCYFRFCELMYGSCWLEPNFILGGKVYLADNIYDLAEFDGESRRVPDGEDIPF